MWFLMLLGMIYVMVGGFCATICLFLFYEISFIQWIFIEVLFICMMMHGFWLVRNWDK